MLFKRKPRSIKLKGGIVVKKLVTLLIIVCTFALIPIHFSQSDQLIKNPPKDDEGRFWVYNEKDGPLPFIPHGWMPAEAAQMINVFDLGSQKDPYEGRTCLAINIQWKAPWWCGIAFITQDAWWAENDKGVVYDLSGVKRLVYYMKGSKNERIQIKVCILTDKPFGDVIKKNGKEFKNPIESEWLTLTKTWEKYTLDLSDYELLRVANGFTFVTSQIQQIDEAAPVNFFIDNIYFSWDKDPKSVYSPKSDLINTWGNIKQNF